MLTLFAALVAALIWVWKLHGLHGMSQMALGIFGQ